MMLLHTEAGTQPHIQYWRWHATEYYDQLAKSLQNGSCGQKVPVAASHRGQHLCLYVEDLS